MKLELLNAITRSQSSFIANVDNKLAFEVLLQDLLCLTGSEYGFIGEVLYTIEGLPYLKTHSITNIAWNLATRTFYEENAKEGLEFYNLKSLFGVVLTSGEPVIANDPANDSRRSGLPQGHPRLAAFLGIPIKVGSQLIAMVAVANRPGGYDQELVQHLEPLTTTVGQLIEARRNELARRQSVAKLEATTAFLTNVMDSASEVSIIATDLNGLITAFNRGAERLLGYCSTEMVGHKTPGHFHVAAEVQARGKELSEECGYPVEGFRVFVEKPEKEGPEKREWTYVRRDGSRFPVSLVVSAMRTPNGELVGYLGIAEDISARKKTEELQARFAAMIESSGDAIIGKKLDGTIISWNPAAKRIFGYDETEVVGKHIKCLIPAELHDAELELLGRLAKGEHIWHHKAERLSKNGSLIHVAVTLSPIRHRNGEIVGILGIVRDITEQYYAEKALNEQISMTRTILDNAVDGIITVDEMGSIISFNKGAELIFSYQLDEVKDKNVKMLMPEPYCSEHDNYLKNYRETAMAKVIGIGREVTAKRKNGSMFPAELAVSEVTHAGKKVFVGIVRDITERKRAEHLKNEFVSTVSHELRTPLTSIIGALGLLAGGALGELGEQAKTFADVAHANSLRLSHLIDDLLDMEKIVAGKLQFEMVRQELMPLIEQAIVANRIYGDQLHVRFELVQRAEGVEIMVDGPRLIQVLSNFLSNAAKFSPAGSVVEIRAMELEEVVRVSVRDFGAGIPDYFRDRLFQKFSQADASDTRQKGGTGLGLAISKELVERMWGKIGYEAGEGKGAVFYFEFALSGRTS